jgi:hypothetical protein
LGEFEVPPTDSQAQLLDAWDLLILDPSRRGILEALRSNSFGTGPRQILARLDPETLVTSTAQELIVVASKWAVNLLQITHTTSSQSCIFTGIVVSNWEKIFSVSVLTEYIIFLESLGLCVYLEVTAPQFLSEPTLAELEAVTGLLIRNGTISANGEERDAFQMAADMRPTIKAFVSQSCLRSFVILLWETLEDDAKPANAIIK